MSEFLIYLQCPSFGFLCKLALLISFWCNGIYITSEDPGDALYFLRKIARRLPEVLAKPFLKCINCMASFHGILVTVMVFIVKGIPFTYFVCTIVPVVVACAFLNGIFILVHNVIHNAITEQHFRINEYKKYVSDNNRVDSGTDHGPDRTPIG